MTARANQQDSISDVGNGGRSLDRVVGEGGTAGGAMQRLAALEGEAEDASLGGIESTATSAARGLCHVGGPAPRSRVARRSQRSAAE